MNAENQSYNEEDDLGIAIDDRIQLGKTAAKIFLAQATANTLVKLLIEKGVFTSEEFVEKMRAKETQVTRSMKEAKAQHPEEGQALADADRFLETIAEGFNSICEKASE